MVGNCHLIILNRVEPSQISLHSRLPPQNAISNLWPGPHSLSCRGSRRGLERHLTGTKGVPTQERCIPHVFRTLRVGEGNPDGP